MKGHSNPFKPISAQVSMQVGAGDHKDRLSMFGCAKTLLKFKAETKHAALMAFTYALVLTTGLMVAPLIAQAQTPPATTVPAPTTTTPATTTPAPVTAASVLGPNASPLASSIFQQTYNYLTSNGVSPLSDLGKLAPDLIKNNIISGLGSLQNSVSNLISGSKERLINLALYPNPLDYPYLPTNPPVFASPFANCGTCCSKPDQILSHLIDGGDPLGEQSLKNWIQTVLYPKMEAAIRAIPHEVGESGQTQMLAEAAVRDAQNNQNYLNVLNQKSATSVVNARPSEQVCRIASVARSLAASELYSRSVQLNLMDRARDRDLIKQNMNPAFDDGKEKRSEGISSLGRSSDYAGRWEQFRRVYCDPDNKYLKDSGICLNSNSEKTANLDIDFARLVGANRQLYVAISPAQAQRTKDSEAVMAMQSNLYAQKLPFKSPNDGQGEQIMDLRALYAMRNIAENSFAAMVAARAAGTGGNANSMKALMKELGYNDTQIATMIGDRPSYEAQMDALSRKLYMGEAFYKNLMDNSTNIKRQQVALESISLMNKRDIYKSLERSELLMAVWLEIKLREKQGALTNKANGG